MSDATVEEHAGDKKSSKLPVVIGVVLALVGGAGGFFVVSADPFGLFGPKASAAEDAPEAPSGPDYSTGGVPGDVGFVTVPTVTIPLGPSSEGRHLRFSTSLEVPSVHVNSVTALMPRVQDVLNSYLRALEPADFDAPGALIRLRAQLLRRIKLVAGEDRVTDLLVLEFIVN